MFRAIWRSVSGGATWSASDSGVLRIKYDLGETVFWGIPENLVRWTGVTWCSPIARSPDRWSLGARPATSDRHARQRHQPRIFHIEEPTICVDCSAFLHQNEDSMSWVRVAVAFAIASMVSTVLITVGTIFLYQGRGFVFGDDVWSPLAWSYARLDTYLYEVVVNFAFAGFPVALCTFVVARRLRYAERKVRIAAVVIPSLATLVPAWWAAAWDGPPMLALLVGSISAFFGAGVFLLAAHLVGYTQGASDPRRQDDSP